MTRDDKGGDECRLVLAEEEVQIQHEGGVSLERKKGWEGGDSVVLPQIVSVPSAVLWFLETLVSRVSRKSVLNADLLWLANS